MKTILALDLGTTTGYALHNGAMISGVWNLKPGRFDGGGMRFLKLRKLLNTMHEASPIGVVYFEEVRRHAGTDAAHVYGGLMGQLTAWCEEMKIPYQGVPVGTIKRSWSGSGSATKERMIEVALNHGFTTTSHDEVDAIALLDYAMKMMRDE